MIISLADFADLGENSKYDWTVVMWSENIRWTNNSKYIYSEYFVFKKKKTSLHQRIFFINPHLKSLKRFEISIRPISLRFYFPKRKGAEMFKNIWLFLNFIKKQWHEKLIYFRSNRFEKLVILKKEKVTHFWK